MKRIVVAALLVVGISGEAGAQSKVYFNDGNALHSHCRNIGWESRHTNNSFASGVCSGYITAIADALGRNLINGYRACVPAGVTTGQVIDVVVQWLQRNPQDRHKPASGLVASALSEAFPCR